MIRHEFSYSLFSADHTEFFSYRFINIILLAHTHTHRLLLCSIFLVPNDNNNNDDDDNG